MVCDTADKSMPCIATDYNYVRTAHCTFDLITSCMITGTCFAYRRISANTTGLYARGHARAISLGFISIFTVEPVSKYSLALVRALVSLSFHPLCIPALHKSPAFSAARHPPTATQREGKGKKKLNRTYFGRADGKFRNNEESTL